jgi:hypothetical protein
MEKKESFPLFGWIEITNQGRWKLRGVGGRFPSRTHHKPSSQIGKLGKKTIIS